MSKVLIITGASSGIGRAVAQTLDGWDGCLVLSGRSNERLKTICRTVRNRGGRAEVFPCDLMEPLAAAELVAAAEECGRLYGLVHAAGEANFGDILHQPDEDWTHTVEINLHAAYRIAREVLHGLSKQKRGRLVFINSVAALRGFPGSSAYVAAKHGLRGLAEAIRLEARGYGVSVSSILPGATDTEWWPKIEGKFPTDRMLKPEDVAQAVKFVLKMDDDAVVEELVLRHRLGDF